MDHSFASKISTIKIEKRSEAKPTTQGVSNLETSLNCSSHTCEGQHWQVSSLLGSEGKKNKTLLAIKQTQQLGIYGIGLFDQDRRQGMQS